MSVRVGPASSNPSIGIKPPVSAEDTEEDARERHPLYARELAKVMTCEEVPLEWRRTYALAVFTFARPEELLALQWRDVDLDAEELRITRAMDLAGKVKSTKTSAGNRRAPTHANLMPLLRAMREAPSPRIASSRSIRGAAGRGHRRRGSARLFPGPRGPHPSGHPHTG